MNVTQCSIRTGQTAISIDTLSLSNEAFLVQTTPVPAIGTEEATRVLREHFGLSGNLEPLSSERDLNYVLTADSGQKFVLKFANSAEDPKVTDFQTSVFRHVAETTPAFPLPRLVRSRGGKDIVTHEAADGREHLVRVLTWLEGTPLQCAKRAPGSAATLGRCLAKLGLALESYEHPGSDYALLWDLKGAASLRTLLDRIGDSKLRALCERRLDCFDELVQPGFDALRWQVIHNDLNPSNVLVEPDNASIVTGVIDFGDLVRSPLIVDVAVACAYLLLNEGDPLKDVLAFVHAYNTVRPLEERDIDVLFDLLLTRSTMTILITHWRASRYPENRDYILRNEPVARRMLARMSKVSRADATRRIREATGLQ